MEEYKPTIPARVRDFAYYTGLVVAAIVLVISGASHYWFPELANQINGTALVVGQGVALLVAGLGVAYRPGAQAAP